MGLFQCAQVFEVEMRVGTAFIILMFQLLLALPISGFVEETKSITAPWDAVECQPGNRKPYLPPVNDRKHRLPLQYGNCPDIMARNFGCHGQRNEDCKIYKRFFKDDPKWRDGSRGFFVEMGGLDGLTFSNTLIFEQCLGWRGMLIEAHPSAYLDMIINRPCTINVWGAVCPSGPPRSHAFMMSDFIELEINKTMVQEYKALHPNDTIPIKLTPCRKLSSVFREANVSVIDFFSLDVEGAEYDVIESIDFDAVRINVLMVESDLLGNRDPGSKNFYNSTLKVAKIHKLLSSKGMIRVPNRGAALPACVRKKKALMVRVYDIFGSELYVHPEFRDDICLS